MRGALLSCSRVAGKVFRAERMNRSCGTRAASSHAFGIDHQACKPSEAVRRTWRPHGLPRVLPSEHCIHCPLPGRLSQACSQNRPLQQRQRLVDTWSPLLPCRRCHRCMPGACDRIPLKALIVTVWFLTAAGSCYPVMASTRWRTGGSAAHRLAVTPHIASAEGYKGGQGRPREVSCAKLPPASQNWPATATSSQHTMHSPPRHSQDSAQ